MVQKVKRKSLFCKDSDNSALTELKFEIPLKNLATLETSLASNEDIMLHKSDDECCSPASSYYNSKRDMSFSSQGAQVA